MRNRHRRDHSARQICQHSRRLIVEALERRICLTAFSSLPGANHTIYLDFDGQSVSGTSWNSYYNQTTLNAQPYDIDGNPASFSATELARIEEAWKRTAEDFRPFNINVTTVDPGLEALRKSGSGDTQWGVRAIITNESTMVTDAAERCGCGGIAYIDSFNWSSDTPVWVYTTGGKSIAEAASHEVGHSLGLSHDGLNSGATYYQGHGSGETGWASIMGVGYYQNVTQWDRGAYYDSNNGGASANYGDGPDDLALIVGTAGPGNGFSYRPDDHGNANVTASSLSASGTSVTGGGVISTTSDVDVFSFTTGAGLVTLNINPFTPGPNLDVKADLYDGAGNLVATSNSGTVLSANFSLNLSAGQYFLHVDGTGWGTPGANPPSGYTEYASLGQYSITGSIVDPGTLPAVSVGNASGAENAGTITFTLSLSATAATTTSVAWSTVDISTAAGSDYVAASGTATFLAGESSTTVTVTLIDDTTYEGNETFAVNLLNPNGLTISDGQGIGTIVEDDAQPLPTLSINDARVNEGKYNTKGKNPGPQLTNMAFTVTLSAASAQTVTVNYNTADGTATTADNDYQAASGTLTFAPGEVSKAVNVTIVGDNIVEPDQTFSVTLTSPTMNASINDGSGMGTIVNDDTKGGGRPNGTPSELNPVAIADPIWFFEGPEAGLEHDHNHHDVQMPDQQMFVAVHSVIHVQAGSSLSYDGLGNSADRTKDASSEELVDLVLADKAFERGTISISDDQLRERLATSSHDDSTDLESALRDRLLDELSDELAEII
jgi:serralysin